MSEKQVVLIEKIWMYNSGGTQWWVVKTSPPIGVLFDDDTRNPWINLRSNFKPEGILVIRELRNVADHNGLPGTQSQYQCWAVVEDE